MNWLRRGVSLLVCIGALYLIRELRASSSSLGVVLVVPFGLVAFFALVMAVFNLPLGGKRSFFEDSGFEHSVLSQGPGRAFGVFLALLFGGLPLFVALRGVSRGVIPAPWSAPDIVFAQHPLQFVVAFLVFAGGGVLLGVLVLKGAWRAKFGR